MAKSSKPTVAMRNRPKPYPKEKEQIAFIKGESKEYPRMTVYMPAAMIKRCKQLALEREVTASEVIRNAVQRYLDSDA